MLEGDNKTIFVEVFKQGIPGAPGTPGAKWLVTDGLLETALGVPGDMALNQSSGLFYQRSETGWELQGSLRLDATDAEGSFLLAV